MEDFNILKVIGRGSYAKVLMCELKKTKQIYAMKVIKKSLVMDEEVCTYMYVVENMRDWNSLWAREGTKCLHVHVITCNVDKWEVIK